MSKLVKVEEVVEKILRQDEYARNNDVYLILKYISRVYPYEVGKRFEEVMTNVSKKGLSFESITRARRKFLEENPELKVEKAEKARRLEEEKYFMEYSNHIPRID